MPIFEVTTSRATGYETHSCAIKYRRGKLKLPATPEEWFAATALHHGLTVLDLVAADALRAPQLPDYHRDPCDRFIIAAALRLDLPIITVDPHFASYGVAIIG